MCKLLSACMTQERLQQQTCLRPSVRQLSAALQTGNDGLGVMHCRDATAISYSIIETQQVSFWAANRGVVFMNMLWATTSQAVEVARSYAFACTAVASSWSCLHSCGTFLVLPAQLRHLLGPACTAVAPSCSCLYSCGTFLLLPTTVSL